jgi:predicted transposase YbfD/YdcC
MAIPLLQLCDLTGRDITADALLTQRAIASYIVEHQGHYHFCAKDNQPHLAQAIRLLFAERGQPYYVEISPPDHGRIETRRIWCSSALNDYLDFPHVGQVFMIERECINKKTGQCSREQALGLTRRSAHEMSARRLLEINRGHWSIEAVHYIIDWNYAEDRSRIRTGHGPENMTRLRRFAVGILKSFQKPTQNSARSSRGPA